MSTVVLDTITGKSTATTITIGSTPVVSASANSMTIRGEGSNQTSIQQGLSKVNSNVHGSDTFALMDSFNRSSATDTGTGRYTVTFTNNMGNNEYSFQVSCQSESGLAIGSNSQATSTTSQFEKYVYKPQSSVALADTRAAILSVFGDLA